MTYGVLSDISNRLRASNMENWQIFVDNAVRPVVSSSNTVEQIPPLRAVRAIDLKALNAARKFRMRQQQKQSVDQESQWGPAVSLPLSSSRWENARKDCPPKNMSITAVPNNDDFTWNMPTNMSLNNLTRLSTRPKNVVHVPLFKMDDEKLSLFSKLPSRRATTGIDSAPVRMPVRKNSMDSLPRKPMRSSAFSRNATISILDEALSVCDLCADEYDEILGVSSSIVLQKEKSRNVLPPSRLGSVSTI